VWLPLNVGGGTMLLSTLQPWSIDVATGIITLIASPASSDQAISPTAAPPAKPAVGGNGFGKPGKVTIDGTVAVDTPASATYINAHLVTENGSTLDSLKLKAFINPTDNTLQKVVATSKVKATFTQAITNRKYTMYCDEAIYDPKLDQVHLTGSVRILIETSYTQGPLVQTGVTALVQLGNGPDYPVITTNDVRTTFTVSK